MNSLLNHSALTEHCRADLQRLLRSFELEGSGRQVTRADAQLPRCITALTSAKAAITKPPLFRPATAAVPLEWVADPELTRPERKLLDSINKRLERTTSAPGKKRRFPALPLSAKEQDFIFRYAEYKHGSKVQRSELTHQKSLAYRAYTDAFLSFMGRPPSVAELQEAERLNFVVDQGRIGVVSQPHAPTPHTHITSQTVVVGTCPQQIEAPTVALGRAARPGSTSLDRQVFSPPRQRVPSARKLPHPPAAPQDAVAPAPPPTAEKKYCTRCHARLPPRLIKLLCPACDV